MSRNGNGALAERPRINIPPVSDTKITAKEKVQISPPNVRKIIIPIVGTVPYLQCRFPHKAMMAIMAKQQAGDKGNSGKRVVRAARDFDADFQGSIHRMGKNEYGIPASAFRAAAISACRLVGYKMTIAKLSIFFDADGYDVIDRTPLVRIDGTPKRHDLMGRNADGGCDIRVRAIYEPWSAKLIARYDADQFSASDVVNLVARIGQQVGIGEGRPDSKNSAGMGFGLFDVKV